MKHLRSIHISYDLADHEKRSIMTRKGMIKLIDEAANRSNIQPQDFRIFEGGCGLGLLMKDIHDAGYHNITGMDFDKNCVNLAAQYGNAKQGNITQISQFYKENEFDVVIFSHVLEHIVNPIELLTQAKKISRHWIVLAIPNPLRPMIIFKYALFRRNYSNAGHVYSWDRSHFTNFLVKYCGLQPVSWATDNIRVFPFAPVRKLLRPFGIINLIEERLLPKLFPYFSSSLIVLCEKKESK